MTDNMTTLLLANGQRQRDEFLNKVALTKNLIRQDCAANGGDYPYNKGKLTIKEFSRRAGISDDALHHVNHKFTTKVEIQQFIAGLTKSSNNLTSQTANRAADSTWKVRYHQLWDDYEKIARNYNLTELRYIKAAERISELEAEVSQLRGKLANLEAVPATSLVDLRPRSG